MAKKESFYRIYYRDPKTGKNTELKAREIGDSPLGLSFVRIADFLFDESSIVLKPAEEQLKKQLEGVKSLHLSIYSIISIEEMGLENKGLKFQKDKSNIVVLAKDEPFTSGPDSSPPKS
ncbi:MAG: DUF1820 family protein [Bdellovibrio sp.]|nr:MAG: DUF1820 family protein [Bdellovibrio sp.]